MIGTLSSPTSKRTRQASATFDHKKFKTLSNFQSYNSHFKNAPALVERVVKLETLGSTFIPIIFANKDWAPLFWMFDEPIEELIKEFYSNTWFTRVELKSYVRGKDFAKIL